MAFWNMGVARNCRSILMLSKVDLYDIKEINNVTGMNQSYTIQTKYGTILILLCRESHFRSNLIFSVRGAI